MEVSRFLRFFFLLITPPGALLRRDQTIAIGISKLLCFLGSRSNPSLIIVTSGTRLRKTAKTAVRRLEPARRLHPFPLIFNVSVFAQTVVDVLIADDHALVRESVRHLIESYPDFPVIGEARNGADAVKLARQLRPRSC